MKKFYLYFYTLREIGLYRLYLRLNYETRALFDKLLPRKILELINKYYLLKINYKKNEMLDLSIRKLLINSKNIKIIRFKFLNEERNLAYPLKQWQYNEWSRLWKFNLHYFDWSRNWLTDILLNNRNKYTSCFPELVDNWIDNNPLAEGDGWHSYTISLRIRNWILWLRFLPDLATKKRIESLWIQTCWLFDHPEKCHGGNHWLENIISLIISSLQFNSNHSKKIYDVSIKNLESELAYQILEDGGHEERSSSYHILILERLTELGVFLQYFKNERPKWLIGKIKKMIDWVETVSLSNGKMPRFNDSPSDLYDSKKDILNFASSFINQNNTALSPIRKNLISLIIKNNINKRNIGVIKKSKSLSIRKLKDTGWYFLNPSNDWELIFKNGIPCPKHLAAHAHSDQLSFDLLFKGIPVFAEVGTSGYENIDERIYERSGEAHNLIQFAINSNNNSQNLNWLESVEVWKSFRSARRSIPIYSSIKMFGKKNLSVSGEHNGFHRYGISHRRIISLSVDKTGDLDFTLKDNVISSRNLFWRQWWHLGPGISRETIKKIFLLNKYNKFEHRVFETYYSEYFGDRKKRLSLCLFGKFKPGKNVIKMPIKIKKSFFENNS